MEYIKEIVTGNVGEIHIAREGKRNAINSQLQDELISALDRLNFQENITVIIIESDLPDFSVGADIGELASMDVSYAETFRLKMKIIAKKLKGSPKIFITYLTGFALGGFLEIAQWSDVILAKNDCKIGQPEVNIGINAGCGGNSLLPLTVGYRNAMYMATTGKIMDASQALRIGLIQDIVNNRDEMLTIAKSIASKDQGTLKAIKESMVKSIGYDPENVMKEEEAYFIKLTQSVETKKLLHKFLNKNKYR
jgi:enoyl-CoA hydratase/carnithine racemase